MTTNELKPTCPKCGNKNFTAVSNGYVANADLSIAMIICSFKTCHTIVGCLPYDAVWEVKK